VVDSAIDRVEVHQRELTWSLGRKLQVLVYGLVRKLFYKVTFPIPLQARGQQWVEQALYGRERHGPDPVKDWGRKLLANWLNYFFRVLQRTAVLLETGRLRALSSAPEMDKAPEALALGTLGTIASPGGRLLHPKRSGQRKRC
jgi:hypothetical protein